MSNDHSSYRPIQNFTFLPKCIETVVVTPEICNHVQDNNLNKVFKSAYKRCHSTETALIKVRHDDILRSPDNKCSVILLSAAFIH